MIINKDGREFLARCLESVLKSDYINFEVIFVDNNSTDDSVEFVRENFKDKRLRIIQCERNYGVPGGRNIGYSKTKGDYVVFLDNDTEVDPLWLKGLVKVFQSEASIAVAQCKLLKLDDRKRFDHAGDYLTPLGFLFERSKQGIDEGQFDSVSDILNAKGAATMIKSPVFKQLGGYDDSYFMYLEETDFCFRAWLSGYRVVFVPGAVVWHAYGTSFKDTTKYYSDYVVRYYGCRNYITTLLKNLSWLSIVKILPIHIFSWMLLSILFALKGKFKDSFWIIKAVFWNILNLSGIIKKRNYIQGKLRKISDSKFLEKVTYRQNLSFYFKKASCYLSGRNFQE